MTVIPPWWDLEVKNKILGRVVPRATDGEGVVVNIRRCWLHLVLPYDMHDSALYGTLLWPMLASIVEVFVYIMACGRHVTVTRFRRQSDTHGGHPGNATHFFFLDFLRKRHEGIYAPQTFNTSSVSISLHFALRQVPCPSLTSTRPSIPKRCVCWQP